MKRREKGHGGFVIKKGSSKISITHPEGKWSALSSSSGGYSDTLNEIILTNKESTSKGFIVGISPNINTASLVSKIHGLTAVSALAIADPDHPASEEGEGGNRISIVLMVDADLPQATMARAAITATESVTCAFQQLMFGRSDTKEIASGSDSICIIVLSNAECERRLYNAGKHSKLGELIGKAVTESVLSSMGKNGATPVSQADVFKRLERFGITRTSCKEYLAANGLDPGKEFDASLERISKDKTMLSYVSSVLHIADEVSWGLIPQDAGYEVCREIICAVISKDAPKSDDIITDLVSAISMAAIKDE